MNWNALSRQFHDLPPPKFSSHSHRRIVSVHEIHNWKTLNEKDSFCDISFRRYVYNQVTSSSSWYEHKYVAPGLVMYIYSSSSGKHDDHARYMTRCWIWLSTIVLPSLLSLHISPRLAPLTITLWHTPFQKTFARHMTPKNINSGEHFGNEISIWRTGEWKKVFLHEALHALKWETYFFSNAAATNLYESWVEFWASFFRVLVSKKKQKWNEQWNKELDHFHTLASSLWVLKKQKVWRQTGTSLNGYYLYKCAWTRIPTDAWFLILKRRTEIDFSSLFNRLWQRTRQALNKSETKKKITIKSMQMTCT